MTVLQLKAEDASLLSRVRARPFVRWLFRAVFGLLTIEFAGLGVFYLADPVGAVRGFSRANQILGGIPVTVPDVPPWRYATAAGMVTAGLMCAMLLADLRRNLPVLWPAAFFILTNERGLSGLVAGSAQSPCCGRACWRRRQRG